MGARVADSRETKRELLRGVPVMRPDVNVSACGHGLLELRLMLERGNGFFDMFRPALTEKRYELDEFGSFVVEKIDGRRTVKAIIDAFRERFGMSRRECELGVVAFLKMLIHRRAATVIAIPES